MGALHQADSIALQNAAFVWHNELAPLKKPLFVVNVGGPTSNLFMHLNCLLYVVFLLLSYCKCQLGAYSGHLLTAQVKNIEPTFGG